eukprot:598866-Prorocentrum_minimum.AAC.1
MSEVYNPMYSTASHLKSKGTVNIRRSSQTQPIACSALIERRQAGWRASQYLSDTSNYNSVR